MNKARLPILIIVVSLTLTAFIALQALANSDSYASSRVGMGDLQRFEAQNALANPGGNVSSRIGMGDLQRFDAQNALSNPGRSASSRAGMGDLQRFESRQISVNAGESSINTPGRVCPSVSTSYGERDAGASAPANVLQVMDCIAPGVK